MTTHHRHGLVIITEYVRPPIPIRTSDWTAHLKDYDGAPLSSDGFDSDYGPPSANNRVGEGRTEEDAIEDLLDQLADLEPEPQWDGDRS
jgi:hypothetical protein